MVLSPNHFTEEREECRKLLVRLPLFSWLQAEHIHTLASQAASASYREGQRIYARGSRSQGIYLVASGEVTFISGHESNPNEQDASTCEAGDYFGELSLIESRPRTSEARATMPTKLFILRMGILEKFAARQPEQFAVLMSNLARQMARRLRKFNASGPGAPGGVRHL